jgi:amidase
VKISEYAEHDATGLSRLIKAGEVSAAEVERAAREAIAAVQPAIKGLAAPLFDESLAYERSGCLAGVPFLIKDLVLHAANVPCESGSRLFKGLSLPYDTELMSRFRRAGLATLGRTTTPEIGFNSTTEPLALGRTHNPWDLRRSPGGSSGGSAALVAAGAVPVAHANDGGGSIRIPASCCGLVGLKPSRGRVPVGPDFDTPLAGMGIEFAVTRTVRDCAALLDAVHGYAPGEFCTIAEPQRRYVEEIGVTPARLRIAFSSRPHLDAEVDAEVERALHLVANVLAGLGHEIVEDAPQLDAEALFDFHLAQWTSFAALLVYGIAPALGLQGSLDSLEPATLACADYGRKLTALDMLRADGTRNAVSRNVSGWMQQYDVYLLPTIASLPWEFGKGGGRADSTDAVAYTRDVFQRCPYTALFNLTGQPAMSLPLACSSAGLPIGMQFAGRMGSEAALLRLAAQMEVALPWRERRPSIHAANSQAR